MFRATSEARSVPRAGRDPTFVSGTITRRDLEAAPRKLSCWTTQPCAVVRRRRLLLAHCAGDAAGSNRQAAPKNLGGHLLTAKQTGRRV